MRYSGLFWLTHHREWDLAVDGSRAQTMSSPRFLYFCRVLFLIYCFGYFHIFMQQITIYGSTAWSCQIIVNTMERLWRMCSAEILILRPSISISAFGDQGMAGIGGFQVNIYLISDMGTQTFTYVIRWIGAKQCALPTLRMLSKDQHGLRKVWNTVHPSCYCQSVKHSANAFPPINHPEKPDVLKTQCFSLEQMCLYWMAVFCCKSFLLLTYLSIRFIMLD